MNIHRHPGMTEVDTVLLLGGALDLPARLEILAPQARLLTAIDPADGFMRFPGPVWCFVDWLLPDISGLEMCRLIRGNPALVHSHVTVVLDEDDSEMRRRALRAGADDYVLGPLTPDLLLSRLRQYRGASGGSNGMPAPRLVHGELTLDRRAHQLRWHGAVIPLRPNEFRLLAHFIEHPDQVFSRTSLIAVLGKDGTHIDERTVDVYVGRLRRALKAHGIPDPLRTVRSLGYVLDSLEARRRDAQPWLIA